MILRCKRCGHRWDYKGRSEWYTSCPRCRTTVKIRKKPLSLDSVIKSLREAMPELASRYGVKRLALFGSLVHGKRTRASDVDMVVELERPLGLEFVDLAEELERVVGSRIDLLTPAGIRSIRAPTVRKNIEESLVHV